MAIIAYFMFVLGGAALGYGLSILLGHGGFFDGTIICCSGLVMLIAAIVTRKTHSTNAKRQKESASCDFFPGRLYSDQRDIVFDFDAYLKSIGAKHVEYDRNFTSSDFLYTTATISCLIGDQQISLTTALREANFVPNDSIPDPEEEESQQSATSSEPTNSETADGKVTDNEPADGKAKDGDTANAEPAYTESTPGLERITGKPQPTPYHLFLYSEFFRHKTPSERRFRYYYDGTQSLICGMGDYRGFVVERRIFNIWRRRTWQAYLSTKAERDTKKLMRHHSFSD